MDREQIAPFSRVDFLSPRRSDASQVPSFPPTRHPSTLSPTQEPLKLPHLFFFCFTRPTSYIYIYIYSIYIFLSFPRKSDAPPRRLPPLPEPNLQPPPSPPLRPFEHLRGRQRFTMYNARTSSSLVSSAAFSKSPEPGVQRKRMGRGEGGSEGNLSLHAVATWRQEGTVQSTNTPPPPPTPDDSDNVQTQQKQEEPVDHPLSNKTTCPSGIVKRASQERGGTKLGVEEKFLV